MDLIGHDTNFAVTQSVFDANFGDKRYRAVAGAARDGRRRPARAQVRARLLRLRPTARPRARRGGGVRAPPVPAGAIVALHGRGVAVDRWAARLERGRRALRGRSGEPLERPADRRRRAAPDRRPRRRRRSPPRTAFAISPSSISPIAPGGGAPGTRAGLAFAASASAAWREQAAEWLRIAGWQPQLVGDAPGLVVARTVAMLVNEGADAVQQGVCTPEGADLAMKLGVNYPAGPFEFLARWDAGAVAALLDRLDAHYRGERYRVSPGLRERAWLGSAAPAVELRMAAEGGRRSSGAELGEGGCDIRRIASCALPLACSRRPRRRFRPNEVYDSSPVPRRAAAGRRRGREPAAAAQSSPTESAWAKRRSASRRPRRFASRWRPPSIAAAPARLRERWPQHRQVDGIRAATSSRRASSATPDGSASRAAKRSTSLRSTLQGQGRRCDGIVRIEVEIAGRPTPATLPTS